MITFLVRAVGFCSETVVPNPPSCCQIVTGQGNAGAGGRPRVGLNGATDNMGVWKGRGPWLEDGRGLPWFQVINASCGISALCHPRGSIRPFFIGRPGRLQSMLWMKGGIEERPLTYHTSRHTLAVRMIGGVEPGWRKW